MHGEAETMPVVAQTSGRRIRILQVVPSLANMGMETVVYQLVKRLDPNRYHVMTCCLSALGGHGQAMVTLGYPIHVLGPLRGISFTHILGLVRLIRTTRPHLIHAHNPTAWFYATAASLIARRGKVMVTRHGMDTPLRWRDRVIHHILAHLTDRVVIVSSSMIDSFITSEHIPRSKLVTIPNGVDTSQFNTNGPHRSTLRAELGIDETDCVVGSIGRLAAVKNQLLLLKAVKNVLRTSPRVKVILVGEGPCRTELAQYCHDQNLADRVLFLGNRTDIPQLLSAVDIFVLSSQYEGTSLSLLEAMASGKPIVATDVGGNSALLQHGRTGLLVPADDPDAMAAALMTLITDRQASHEMGQRARAYVRAHFDLHLMMEQYDQLYQTLAREPGGTRSLSARTHADDAPRWTMARHVHGYKTTLASALHHAGLAALYTRAIPRGVVLSYHRIMQDDEAAIYFFPAMVVTTANFKQQIDVLRRYFKIVPLREFVDQLSSGIPFSEYTVSLTFDDGYRDNYTHAYPILKAHGIPATFFLAAGLMGTRKRFWYDEIALIIDHLLSCNGEIPAVLNTHMAKHPRAAANRSERIALMRQVVNMFKHLQPQQINGIIDDMRKYVRDDALETDAHTTLTWDMAREMAGGGMRFGSHGLSHQILTNLPAPLAHTEIWKSKRTMESELGGIIDLFAYPNGDYNDETVRLLKACGYKAAMTVGNSRPVTREAQFAINRKNVCDADCIGPDRQFSESLFLCETIGLLHRLLLRHYRPWTI